MARTAEGAPSPSADTAGLAYASGVALAASGYTVDDLVWARQQFGTAHIELDPWGNLIVTPASDPHEIAAAILHTLLVRQLDLPGECVLTPGLAWRVPGGTGYTNVPDLMIVAAGAGRVDELHLAPPPLLVVEIASPSTRAIDRSRKLDDYRTGGAGVYLLVDLPGLTRVDRPTADMHDFGAGTAAAGLTGTIGVRVGDSRATLDLDRLTPR